ncbi:hypothetical protein [Bacillus sp. P14.5]|uniref:hypothetical protein n=1 Tax=Bacillus sp. P14.5 TaxID=1983400 RepID=UPI0013B06134|nr:hypothetical protein [Bacillus sp. P14.5]
MIQEEVEIDLFNSFTLMNPLASISQIEWRVESFKGWALPPSSTVFLELVLSADIEFAAAKDGSLQSLKIFIPLQKTVQVHWRSAPEFPSARRGEYEFKEKEDVNLSSHRVWEEKLAHPILFEIRSFKLLWHDELEKGKEGNKVLGVQGTAKVSIEASQKQMVSLNL